MTKKLFRKIHLWLSVPFGLVMSITCLTGALLVFEKEVDRLVRPELFYVDEVKGTPLPDSVLIQRITATLPDSIKVTGINSFDNPRLAYQARLSKPRKASLYVDQYTGEVKGRYQRLPFFITTFRLHRWLLGPARSADGGIGWGKLVVGISTLLFVFVLISGLVIWWPRNRKVLKNNLTVKVRKGWRRFWHDLHVAGGFYTLLVLLALALTGLTWSFSWWRDAVYALLDGFMPTQEIRTMIRSIHMGTWGGLFSRILTCLAALVGGILPLTGYYIWLRRIKKSRNTK